MHIPTISVGFLVPVVVATAAFWVSGLAVGAAVAAAAEAEDPFAANVRPTEPRTPAEQLKTLKVPAGFAVQLVAHEPDVHKPMNLAFDAAGRLWVTTSREYPFPVPVGQAGRDRVMIFEDFGADGRARKVTEFAGGLNIPTGVYPFRTPNTEGRDTWKAVVWSIPNLWLMEDTDGDGKADRREKLYGPFDHTRDTHGNQSSFRRGFDGWLYATHGFNNDSHVAGRDGHRVDLNSGNTYRMRLDGSRLEHYTWGQVNPFGLAWDPQGNLYSSDCHSEPIYLLLAGGYYPSFGKPDDGLGFAPNMMEKIRGSTAIDGISFYADNLWPAEYRDAVFVGDVMTSRVYRDTAVARGSGRVTRQEPDFVVSEDPWFRPVDTTIGPDGAMYVADFYNRIIGHYEVPLNHPGRDRERGRIWRVVPLNAEGKPALRNPAIAPDLEGLVGELGSPSLPRRMLAMNDLADRFGTNAVPRLRQVLTDMRGRSSFPENTEDAFRHVHALWLLERLGAGDWSPRGFGLAYPASRGNPLLRIHTRRILIHRGEQAAAGDAEARERVKPLLAAMAIPNLKDPDPVVRRVSAQALATTPAFEHLRPLLDALALADPVDTHLVYALRQALRNQLLDGAVMARVLDATWSAADTKALAGVAVAARTEGAGVFLVRHLDRLAGDGDLTSRALAHAARYAPSADVDTLVAAVRQRSPGDVDFQLGLFRSLQQGFAQRGTALTAAMSDWGAGLARALLASVATGRSEPAGVPPTAVAPANVVARQVAAAELVGAVGGAAEDTRAVLARLAQDRSADPAARGAAARVVSEDPVVRAAAELAADGGQPREWRVRTADVLFDEARAGAEELIADVWKNAPHRFQVRFAGLAAASPRLAAEIVGRMSEGRAPAGLLRDRALRDRLRRVGDEATRGAIDRLVASLPDEDDAARRMLEERLAGYAGARTDVKRGREVFVAGCAACHQINGEGGLVGPQLTGIGTRGAERLCEDILVPNRNVDHAFWTTVLTLKDGETATGLFRREEGEVLVLANAAGAEFGVPKSEVVARKESNVSVMPGNWGEALSAEDFYHLLAYLVSQTGRP